MYLKLSLINLRAKPLRTILTASAVIISITFLSFFQSFESGLQQFLFQNTLNQNPLTQLNVKPQGQGVIGLNPVNLLAPQRITPETIEQIRKIPHITSIEAQTTIKGISSLQVNLFNQWFQTDALIFGSPYETIQAPHLTSEQWQTPESFDNNHPIPALISTKLLDLYNYSFAAANGLPQINPQTFVGTEIDILLNKSTFFNSNNTSDSPRLRAKIIGFSPKVKLIGLTIPQSTIERINQQYLNTSEKNISDLIVKIDSTNHLEQVKKNLKELNLETTSSADELKNLDSFFIIVNLAFEVISLIILTICGLMIANTFLTKVAERTKDIGIMKSLGATPKQITLLFLTEAGLLGTIGGLIGYTTALVLAFISNQILQNLLQNLQNKPENFFHFSSIQFFLIQLFSILFCMIFAFLPARQAAKLHPLTALNK